MNLKKLVRKKNLRRLEDGIVELEERLNDPNEKIDPTQRVFLKETVAGLARLLDDFRSMREFSKAQDDPVALNEWMMRDQYRQWELWTGMTEPDENGFGILLTCRHPLPPPPPLPWPGFSMEGWVFTCETCGEQVTVEFVEPAE